MGTSMMRKCVRCSSYARPGGEAMALAGSAAGFEQATGAFEYGAGRSTRETPALSAVRLRGSPANRIGEENDGAP